MSSRQVIERLKNNVSLIKGLFPSKSERGKRKYREVLLYGSSHDSEAIAQDVGDTVLDRKPDTVFLEICQERAKDLQQYLEDSWFDFLFRRKLQTGLDAVAAWRAANHLGSRVILGDRPFSEIQSMRQEYSPESDLHEAKLEDWQQTSFVAGRNSRLFQSTEDLDQRRRLLEEWSTYPDPMWKEMIIVYSTLAYPEDSDEFFAALRAADKLISPSMYRYELEREDHMVDRILEAEDSTNMVAVIGRCHLRPLEKKLSEIVAYGTPAAE